jgi:hypothetical protein
MYWMVGMNREEFIGVAEETLDSLPEELRSRIGRRIRLGMQSNQTNWSDYGIVAHHHG